MMTLTVYLVKSHNALFVAHILTQSKQSQKLRQNGEHAFHNRNPKVTHSIN